MSQFASLFRADEDYATDLVARAPGRSTLTQYIQRRPAAAAATAPAAAASVAAPGASVIADDPFALHLGDRASDGPGASLAAPVQARMEAAFNLDLGAVRVHEGPAAPARGAVAYAQGADLHFAPGRFDPTSASGLGVLAHELAHVAQHAEGRAPGPHAYGAGGDPALEAEADAMAARVLRGEAARPGAARLAAVRDPDSAIQHMVETDAPANGATWDAIEKYVERTLINQRKQTFKEQVEEFIAAGAGPAAAVNHDWQAFVAVRGQAGQELAALGHLRTIRTTINTHQSQTPDHPNKRGIGPGRERYQTVPQSAQSQTMATNLRGDMLAQLLPRFDGTTRIFTAADGSTRRLPNGEHWATTFMLGVLVRPDGQIMVAHSGFMGPTQQAEFVRLVAARGATAVAHNVASYNHAQDAFAEDLEQTGMPPDHSVATDDANKDKVVNWPATEAQPIEAGNPIGVCAASQLVDGVHGLNADFPAILTGNTTMALTEVWVAANPNSRVSVNDASDTERRYSGNTDVPSCLTCQHQLRIVLRKLTDLRRNVVNLGKVQAEEGTHEQELLAVAQELNAILASADRVVTRILGPELRAPGKTARRNAKKRGGQAEAVEVDRQAEPIDAAAERQAFEKLLAEYRGGVKTQAKERTKHPEHVEHDRSDRSTTARSARDTAVPTVVAAEDRTDDAYHRGLLATRETTGKLMGGGEAYHAARGADPQVRQVVRGQVTDLGTASSLAEQATRERGHEQAAEVAHEAAILEAATRAKAKIAMYLEQGYFTERRARWLEKLIVTAEAGFAAASTAIRDAAIGGNHVLHAKLQAALVELDEATALVDVYYRKGMETLRDRRADEEGVAAEASARERQRTQGAELRAAVGEENLLYTAAQIDAEQSSARREASEPTGWSSEVLERADGLARLYDVSLARALEMLENTVDPSRYAPQPEPESGRHDDDMYG